MNKKGAGRKVEAARFNIQMGPFLLKTFRTQQGMMII